MKKKLLFLFSIATFVLMGLTTSPVEAIEKPTLPPEASGLPDEFYGYLYVETGEPCYRSKFSDKTEWIVQVPSCSYNIDSKGNLSISFFRPGQYEIRGYGYEKLQNGVYILTTIYHYIYTVTDPVIIL